jgi:membrane-bound serine protease (ClpP class)
MADVATLTILYAVGVVILIAEFFIPSHGLLTVAGLGFLIAAVAMTFKISTGAGFISILALLVLLPVAAAFAIRYWPRTWIGRKIAPPNPVLTTEDTGNIDDRLRPFVGRHGRSVTPLRPIGTCVFDGQRLECVAEVGMIEPDQPIKAVGIRGRNLTVRVCTDGIEQEQANTSSRMG